MAVRLAEFASRRLRCANEPPCLSRFKASHDPLSFPQRDSPVLATFLAGSPFLHSATPPADPATADLTDLERRRSEAIASGDLDFLRGLYADEFRGITATGYEVDKNRLLAVLARGDSGVKFTLEVLSAQVLGEAAFVTGRVTGKSPQGETTHDSKYVHIYRKRGERWQMIYGQGTMLPSAVAK